MFPVGRGSKGRGRMVSRRDFLRVGSLSVVGLSIDKAALARARDLAARRSCIFLLMTGGPSQLETFDPKPDAPAQCRGPLRAISTAIPGVQISEGFPGIAERMKKVAIIRSMTHDAAPIHETGLQMLQTGRLAGGTYQFPSFGSVVARSFGARNGVPPYVVLPRAISETGVNIDQGQNAGFLGDEFAPAVPVNLESSSAAVEDHQFDWHSATGNGTFDDEPAVVQDAYGFTQFGRLCWQSARLVEHGARCVTVNLFDALANQVTWDCHASRVGAPGTLYDYRDELCPRFDRAFSALLDDLQSTGLLQDTLVVATGEFGRTPRLNAAGGRDHWPGAWSTVLAGGGVQGGQVIGATDAEAATPVDRPVVPGELTATIYRSLGLDRDAMLQVDDETEVPLVEHDPVQEVFG
jgi:uncharacterized protein (DUF1501 family)